jgi:diacylglycerol kinase (ATP)
MAFKFIIGRIKGIFYSLKGGIELLRTEPSIQVQFVLAILVTIAGFYFDISREEWMMQILCIGLVMGLEGLNTALEEIADFVHPDHHPKIGRLKDFAAGAVGIAALVALLIASIIYIPKLV